MYSSGGTKTEKEEVNAAKFRIIVVSVCINDNITENKEAYRALIEEL